MKERLKLLLPLLAVVSIGTVVAALYINSCNNLFNLGSCIDLFNPERGQISSPSYMMEMESNTAEGFAEVTQLGHRLVLHQGEVGKINVTLKRQNSKDRLSIVLRFYGKAPYFNEWISIVGVPMDNSGPKQSLPEGVTYSTNPSLVALTTDKEYSSTLTIALRPDAQIGIFKLTLEAHLRYPTYEHTTGLTDYCLILEVRPSDQ